MRTPSILGLTAIALIAVFTGVTRAHAAGVVFIDSCQTLGTPNAVYKLTTDLTSCDTCLILAADRITVDLQNHSITSTCPYVGAGIADLFDFAHANTVVKNGAVSGYVYGVLLSATRGSVIDVEASNNSFAGIRVAGASSLVKSCVVRNNAHGVWADGDRPTIQQCDASSNTTGIVAVGSHCLVTMNFTNDNGGELRFGSGIEIAGSACTVSFNTANDNGVGIFTLHPSSRGGHLITRNTALGNRTDYVVTCPSDVTLNTSSSGFPSSYFLEGSRPCHTVNNK